MKERAEILETIEHLLNLSNSKVNEHEAHVAMLMAQKLMAKHMIEEHELLGLSKEIEIAKVESKNRTATPWARHLSRIIAKNFGCLLYRSTPHRSKASYTVFFGEEDKAEAACLVYDFALSWLAKASSNYATRMRNTKGIIKGVKQDYIVGFLEGLEAQYAEQVKTEECFALMVVVPQEVKNAFQDMNLKSHTLSNRMFIHGSDEAREAGYYDGYTFNKGLTTSEVNKHEKNFIT